MASAGQPFDWNTVIVGAWNLAILTPGGITRRLFELPPGTPVEIQVPIDRETPIRVIHGGTVVLPSAGSLVVAPRIPSADALQIAAQVAQRAIRTLPETPLTAVGVNLRYRFASLPDELIEALRSSLDDQLADKELRITARSMKRSIPWQQGKLNLEVQETADVTGRVMFNFDCQSTNATDLANWLDQIPGMVSATRELLADCKIQIEEYTNERHQ